jgi:alkanesulfonate monooxygenase SsuD/methylene tetrahydromethanopterin reductase-like flavin-dependent oxidoreductase (luciferase family)
MTDLGRPIAFGGSVDPITADPTWPLRLTQTIEAAGLTFVGIQDHPYNLKFFDTWTLLATLAQATSRVRFFPNVANLPLRPPTMLAKAVASLDVLTQGRVELGLGAGAFWEGIAAMGGPTRRPGEAVAALEEAIQIIRLFWSGQRSIRFEGEYYTVQGARPGPSPAHAVGIWLGAYGPRMLALTGRLADGWIPSISYAPPEQLPEMQQRINDAALAAGRQPQEIRRVYNLMGYIGLGPKQNRLDGPATEWIEELTRFVVELSIDTFIFWPTTEPMRQMEVFAAEVVPGVHEAINLHRNIIT